jgi:ribosomal protein S18 acetylase RimI-like enzyme
VDAPRSSVDLAFERVRLADLPEVIVLALEQTDPRIAAYAVEPRGAVRRARLKGWLAAVPWLGARLPAPERSFWILSGGRRAGFVLLHRHEAWLHLQLVVLTRALRGTGAADRVVDFVEEQARAAGARGVDLHVDRRNYRAYHLYQRRGFRFTPERRFVFEVPRSGPPGVRALAAVPWHALAEVFGAVGTRGLGARGSLALQEGGLAVCAIDDAGAVDDAVAAAFHGTLARAVRISLPFAANVPGGRLIAVLHRMEKVLA